MRKTKMIEMGRKVATSLVAAERDLDAAMQSTIRLMDDMLEARIATGVPLATGQMALRSVAGAVAQLVDVRETLINGHGELAGVKETLPFIREMGLGDASECPSPNKAELPDLRVVA